MSRAPKPELRAKLRAEHAKRGVPKRQWTPEKVRERIRIGLLAHRVQQQALGAMRGHEVYWVPKIIDGEVAIDYSGPKEKPLMEARLRSKAMTALELSAALALLDKCIPKAVAPQEVNIGGTIIVEERDPTQENPSGERRRRRAAN